MSGWLLDTNVISELRKAACNARVRRWVEAHDPESLFMSTVVLAEIRFGIERHPDNALRAELASWLDHHLRPWFGSRILGLDEDVILQWRRLVEQGRKAGHTFSQPDLFIAATAAVNGLCVVTRNVTDFELAGVPVVNPWEAA